MSSKLLKRLEILEKQLLQNGFYDIIDEFNPIVGSSIQKVQWGDCKTRLGIQPLNLTSEIGIKYFLSPCRLGREIKSCTKALHYNFETNQTQLVHTINNGCPLCNVMNSYYFSPCKAFTRMKTLNVRNGIYIIPNGFPYFPSQFLITNNDHMYNPNTGTQQSLHQDFQLFKQILSISGQLITSSQGTIFFNGLCGNSLIHLHIQYTPYKSFPIFDKINNGDIQLHEISKYKKSLSIDFFYPEETGNNKFFTGLILTSSVLQDIQYVAFKTINIIIQESFLYNFILQRNNKKYQFIIFVRDCHSTTKDLGLGSTELAGVIVSNKIKYTDHDVLLYSQETNNIKSILQIVPKLKKIRGLL